MAKKKTSKKKVAKKQESKTLKKNQMKALTRFENLKDQLFRLSKIGAKNNTSFVGVGHSTVGDFSLLLYKKSTHFPRCYGAFITGFGFDYLRTSPIVAILESNENSTTFETVGGIYKLEKYVRPTNASDN